MSKRRQSVTFLPLENVRPHPNNVRDDLGDLRDMAASIRRHGILQPLVVTEHPTQPYTYLLLAGHRRLAAAGEAGMKGVPCIIRHDIADDGDLHTALMLIENHQRRSLSPMEKARAIGKLLDNGLTQVDVGKLIGITPSSVASYSLLLDLDEDTAQEVEDGNITAAEARDAVREARAKTRQEGGTPVRGRPVVVEPAYLTVHHPLAATVRSSCDHTTRPLVGSMGCGQCWESAILAAAGVTPGQEVSA